MAAWLSSTGISYQNLLPHTPSICFSTVNSSPRPGIAPQSLHSSSQLLCLPAAQDTCVPVRGMHSCGKDCLILIPFRLPQISCFTLCLGCFSSDSDNCPAVGIGLLLQFPQRLRAGPVLLTLLFPSFYRVLHGSNTLDSISQLSKSIPQPVTLKKLKLNGFMKTYKTF